jgi:hypothetical protein
MSDDGMRDCPFCLYPQPKRIIDADEKLMWISCPNCGASTGKFYCTMDVEEYVRSVWNRRDELDYKLSIVKDEITKAYNVIKECVHG